MALWTIFGLIGGAVAGSLIRSGGRGAAPIVIGALVVGVLGYLIGQARAFMLRLQAQTALCQVRIERNTRARTP